MHLFLYNATVVETAASGRGGFKGRAGRRFAPEAEGANVIVTVSSRHMDVTPALKSFAEQKAQKLTKYYDRIQEIEVIMDANKDGTNVEMIVNAEHNAMFIAHHGEGDAYACIDGCVDKLERQLTDHKERFRNRKHPAGQGTREGNTRQR